MEVESMAKVRILGFDPGTANMGWARLDGDTSEIRATENFGVQKTSLSDGDFRKRIDILGDWMEGLIKFHNPSHLGIEDFTEQGVNAGKVYKEMATLIEHMRLVARGLGHEDVILTNSEWKMILTGSKGLNKDQVKHFVAHNVPNAKELYTGKTATHVWDACGIAYAKYFLIRGK
jgi:Holliday junction resolvasome RuvABC endonuclease subunit